MKENYCSYQKLAQVCLVVAILSLLLLVQLDSELTNFTLPSAFHFSDKSEEISSETYRSPGFVISTNGCRIPDLDPFDASIQKFISNPKKIRCAEEYGPALVESNLTSVFINVSVLPFYNVTEEKELECCYTPFWREELDESPTREYQSDVDSQVRFANFCTPFFTEATIRVEFIRTKCFVNNTHIYTDYHAFVPASQKVIKKKNKLNYKSAVSVLIIGVDAVSRLNLHRQMPLTVEFLKKNLSAIEMLGYNKVADNTFPNLIPVFTGLSEEELKQSCWQEEHFVFDDCNFIWNNFSTAGFKTAFAEDASWMGIFNYVKRGFRTQPTDYYMRVFNKVGEKEIGFDKRLNANLCFGPRKTIETLLNYAYKFAVSLKDILSFGFFWGTSLTHDFFNLPREGDENHKDLLEKLFLAGVLNKTILIFMSDHGIRWGGIRETYQGYLEERLPFLFIAYPQWFSVEYTAAIGNLERNARKLTTPFDLHETLLDIMDLKQLEKKNLRNRSESLGEVKTLPRGISLFLPISGNRTCQDAGIVDHWCTCHHSYTVSTNETRVIMAAEYLVKHINFLLKDYSECAQLKLNRITNAREEKSTSHLTYVTSDAGITDYSLTIETVPGKAMFEANIRRNENTNNYILVGTVSRINLYGNQSSCVPKYRLRLYCYCIH